MSLTPPDLNVQAAFQEAMVLHQQGQLAQAQALYEEVLRVAPDQPDVLHLSGLVALQGKNYALASERIGKAARLAVGNAAYHVNHGIALKELGAFAAAVESYDKAIALQPTYAAAYYSRGNALSALRQFEAAVASFEQALALNPGDLMAQFNRGLALQELKKHEAALDAFDRVLSMQPDHAQAYFMRGNSLLACNRVHDAVASFDRTIALTPTFAPAYYNRGAALQALSQREAACASYAQACAVDPTYHEAWFANALVLLELGRFDEAAANFERVTAIRPDDFAAHNNRAIALRGNNRIAEAIASWDRALAVQPDSAEAQFSKSLDLLLSGQFEQGWELFEWRWKRATKIALHSVFQQPLWNGRQSLRGKSILLHHEQGLGDTLQFCRYAPQVAALGARVIMEVPQSLMGVMQSLQGVDEWIVTGERRPDFDYHCPMLSLPRAFQTVLTTIPAEGAYLYADAESVARWSGILGGTSKPRVGIVWSGNPKHLNDHNRSLPLELLLKCIGPDMEVVSLQKELRATDQEVLRHKAQVRHFGDELRDFADTAALCSLMDVVVSVDTSVAHLSAALHRPTWVLLPFCPDWRWLLGRNDNPWYPSVRLFRQPAPRDWLPVLEQLEAHLGQLVRKHASFAIEQVQQ